MKEKINDLNAIKIFELLELNFTKSKIAEIIGVSRPTLDVFLKKIGKHKKETSTIRSQMLQVEELATGVLHNKNSQEKTETQISTTQYLENIVNLANKLCQDLLKSNSLEEKTKAYLFVELNKLILPKSNNE